MAFPAIHYGNFGDEKVSASAKINGLPLGIKMILADGREFRHARAGASALVAGKIMVAPSSTADADYGTGLALAATAAVGATTVLVTPGGTTAVTANLFQDGWLTTASSAGTGIGYTYKVKSNNSAATGATCTVTLYETDPLIVALAGATTKVSLTRNQYQLVDISPASTAVFGRIVGVPCASAAASSYFWAQCGGEAPVFVGGTVLIKGESVVCSTAVAGAAVPIVASTAGPTSDKAMIHVIGECIAPAETGGFATVALSLG